MMTKQTDPVCGMQVDPEHAAARIVHEGKTYYFCSDECKNEWATDPDGYASRLAAVTSPDDGAR